jgi:cobalamin biosynthesis Mg chelatase CobN
MRIEHKLSPVVTAYVQRSFEQLKQLRSQYLAALGQAKEAELQSEIVRQSLSQQLALIEQSEHLPPSVSGYALSPDGAMLIGETERAEASVPALAVNGNG